MHVTIIAGASQRKAGEREIGLLSGRSPAKTGDLEPLHAPTISFNKCALCSARVSNVLNWCNCRKHFRGDINTSSLYVQQITLDSSDYIIM